jgi:hypothetical protein
MPRFAPVRFFLVLVGVGIAYLYLTILKVEQVQNRLRITLSRNAVRWP